MQLERLKAVAKRVGYHPVHLRRLVKAGKFPKPVALGPHAIAFLTPEVDAWIQARIDARDRKAQPAPDEGE